MKQLIKKFSIALVIILTLSFTLPYAVPMVSIVNIAEAAAIGLNKSNINVNVGETYQLKLVGTKSKVKWSSGKKSIATVSSDGLITAKKVGSIIVSANADGIEYNCTVNVVQPSIYANYNGGIGVQTQFKVKNLFNGYSKEDVIWSSSDEKIITIDKSGLSTTISIGEAKINATFGNTSLSWKIKVHPSNQEIKDAVKNFKMEEYNTSSNIVCIMSNPSIVNLSLEYQVEFYDASNIMVSISSKNYFEVLAKDECVIYIQKPDKSYSYYKIKYISKRLSFSSSLKDKVSVNASEEYDYSYQYSGENYTQISDTVRLFDLSVNNQSGKRAFINAYALYYKDNKLVKIVNFMTYANVDVGETILKYPISQIYAFQKIDFPIYDSKRIIYSAKESF